ncbi:MAG TPA: hypothetical protein VGH65_11285 [Verrucomicrobiaceae bacterium]
MFAHLSLNPVWLPLDENLMMMKGQRLRVITKEGAALDTIVKIGMEESENGKKSCSVLLTDPTDHPRQRAFLTKEALQFVTPASESQRNTDFVLDCRKMDTGVPQAGVKAGFEPSSPASMEENGPSI